MPKSLMLLAAAASAAIVAGPALAVTIDNFDTEQYTQDDPSAVIDNKNELFDPNVLGLFRDVASFNDGGVRGGTQATVNATGRGRFSVSNASETSGNGTLTYDGMDGAAAASDVATYGLGGVDLTGGLTNGFFSFDVVFTDAPFSYMLTLWDIDSSDSYSGSMAADASGSVEMIYFSWFSGIDFTDIGAIQLSFSGGDAADLSIDNFMTGGDDTPAVPLPASLPLLLAGVGGIAALKRRKA